MNPILLSEKLCERAVSYLRTSFYFSDPGLRKEFRRALEDGGIHKGPFIERMPAFKRGCLPEELPGAESLAGLLEGRSLFRHQERAIRRVLDGRNVVLATPTGSGKTEAYLLPIVLSVLSEPAGCPSGVRALVLYPMNALANDQRRRLGEYAAKLEKQGASLTFGRYTGETPEDQNDGRRQGSSAQLGRERGELIFRKEMRVNPPGILLTNFSMLEYLLLRPDDSPIFDNHRGASWRFLVLDEAHQYRGAKGIEMALLIRRLKQRLRAGGCGPLRCIATSASMGRGEQDRATLAEFASLLFDEPFEDEDVVLEEVDPGGSVIAGARTLLQRLIAELDKPRSADELAAALFPEWPAGQQRSLLSKLLDEVSGTQGSFSVSVRYHLFIRALEGAFLQIWPAMRLALTRGAPVGAADAGPWFELALCRECGQHYLVGRDDGTRLVEPDRDRSSPDYGVTYFLPLDGADAAPEGGVELRLCTRCAALWPPVARPPCSHGSWIRAAKIATPDGKEDRLSKCAACGYRGPDPVREVVHGADAPNAVIATALYQHLPAGRRKILAFADGRQEAAFFAWFADDSYRRILGRNLLVRSLRRAGAEISMRTLADHLADQLRSSQAAPQSEDDFQIRKRAWLIAYREFANEEPRISAEGVALLQWSLTSAKLDSVSRAVKAHAGAVQPLEIPGLVQLLLDSLRQERAFRLQTDLTSEIRWDELCLNGPQQVVDLARHDGTRGAKKRPNCISWDKPGARRGRLAERAGVAPEFLAILWDALREQGALTPEDGGLRLDPGAWRVGVVSTQQLYRCATCNRVQRISVRSICARPRCEGTLQPIDPDDHDLLGNHYRHLYQDELPAGFRAEEHTAQLDPKTAAEFQRGFTTGAISLLSSSTTFELGVDLGDLDTTFLRNVPPEPFNYAQRVGRAGRRAGRPGFAITYCRRAPHDLACFYDPVRTISGRTAPPVLRLTNQKIATRHAAASVLSEFFRRYPGRFKRVRDFFGEPPAALAAASDFIARERSSLESAIRDARLFDLVQVGGSDWGEAIAGAQSSLAKLQAELAHDLGVLEKLEREAAAAGRYDQARRARDRRDTLLNTDTLSFLSAKAVIPKYGFPVDVVALEPAPGTQAYGVKLDRDLSVAVAEFAPGSELIANKKIWTSYGLKRVEGKEWGGGSYWRCGLHGTFSLEHPDTQCCSELRRHQYIDPGFGFTARPEVKPPVRKPERLFATRPYFAGLTEAKREPTRVSDALSVARVSPGRLVVLCEGRKGLGFRICRGCGAGLGPQTKSGGSHAKPQGGVCNGHCDRDVALGHEFVTDVFGMTLSIAAEPGADPRVPAWSTAYAVLYGAAEVLEVPLSDLNVTAPRVRYQDFEIVLYDAVPGGAGLVARLGDAAVLRAALETARDRTSGRCGCAEQTSCQGCLRSYYNQFAHPWLARGAAQSVLSTVLAGWAHDPETSSAAHA